MSYHSRHKIYSYLDTNTLCYLLVACCLGLWSLKFEPCILVFSQRSVLFIFSYSFTVFVFRKKLNSYNRSWQYTNTIQNVMTFVKRFTSLSLHLLTNWSANGFTAKPKNEPIKKLYSHHFNQSPFISRSFARFFSRAVGIFVRIEELESIVYGDLCVTFRTTVNNVFENIQEIWQTTTTTKPVGE